MATATGDAGPVATASEHPEELGATATESTDKPAFEETGTHS